MEFLNQSADIVGLNEVLTRVVVSTPYGLQAKRNMRPFAPEQFNRLTASLDVLSRFVNAIRERRDVFFVARQWMNQMRDLSGSLRHLAKGITLSQVELYELKHLLLQIKKLSEHYVVFLRELPIDLQLCFPAVAYSVIDPALDYLDTFYIDDQFSPELAHIRQTIQLVETAIRRHKVTLAKAIMADYSELRFRPNGTVVIDKQDAIYDSLLADTRLTMSEQHYSYVTFGLVFTRQLDQLLDQQAELLIQEEEALFAVRQQISQSLAPHVDSINCQLAIIGQLDLYIAKANLAVDTASVKPVVAMKRDLTIVEGRHLLVERRLIDSGSSYTPISLTLDQRATIITGANMGGKTIALKTIGLIVAMSHYGLYVPAKRAIVPYYHFISAIIGDEQSVDRGLSTFGAEIQTIVETLRRGQRGLVLIDELARGTNPTEGWALSDSLIEALSKLPSDSVVTTHYEGLGRFIGVVHLRVKGLRELPNNHQGDFIERLAAQMDYRLERVSPTSDLPRDALTIAQLLGMPTAIIDGARRRLNHSH